MFNVTVLPDTLVATLIASGCPSAQQPHPYIPAYAKQIEIVILKRHICSTCPTLPGCFSDIPPLELPAATLP